jgi:uncharacterized protein (TIGR02118 family)
MLRPALSFCLFVSFSEANAGAASRVLRELHLGQKNLLHTPARARDPYLHDGAPPDLVVQAYFAALPELEAKLPVLEKALGPGASCEAMLVRALPVPEPGSGRCSYLVAYAGPAEDPDAWRAHYLAHHAPIMAELPGIRELELYAPVAWHNGAGTWKAVVSLQRNKVAFDSPQALEAALASPVRAKMRADFAAFPPYSGSVIHYPMLTSDPWQEK